MAYLQCWLQNSTLPYHSISLRERFYLDYGKVIFFKALVQTEIWLQGILRATACCALSWVLIITVLFVLAMAFGRFAFFEVENIYSSSICVTWVWAVGFAVYLSVRTYITSEELVYISTTWRAPFNHQSFNKSKRVWILLTCKDTTASLMNSSLPSSNIFFFVT